MNIFPAEEPNDLRIVGKEKLIIESTTPALMISLGVIQPVHHHAFNYMYTVHTWIGHAFPYCNQIFLVPFGDFFIHFLHLVRVHCPEAALARVGTICVRILNLLEALIQGEVVSHGILVSEPANV